MTTLEVLRKARELISNPKKWCQGWYAKDRDGIDVYPDDASACRFCAAGAVMHVCQSERFVEEAIESLRYFTDGHGISTFNDHHSHREVMQMFDKAIAMLERKAKRK